MIREIKHPLILHKLSILRDKTTGTKKFRELSAEISILLAYEAMRDIKLITKEVVTPIATANLPTLYGKKMALVPILRAGLAMADAISGLVPAAKVGHIGLYRDPKSHLPIEYYCKLPEDIHKRDIFVLDPMLATGGSAIMAIDLLKRYGAKKIKFICIVSAPEGINKLQESHPEIEIITAAIDEKLDDNAYVVPGLGDAGDRIYGTK